MRNISKTKSKTFRGRYTRNDVKAVSGASSSVHKRTVVQACGSIRLCLWTWGLHTVECIYMFCFVNCFFLLAFNFISFFWYKHLLQCVKQEAWSALTHSCENVCTPFGDECNRTKLLKHTAVGVQSPVTKLWVQMSIRSRVLRQWISCILCVFVIDHLSHRLKALEIRLFCTICVAQMFTA